MKPLASFREVLGRFPAIGDLVESTRHRSIPHVQQIAATDCGPACLAMVLRYYGKAVRFDEVRAVTGTARDGASSQTIIDAGRWFGLRGRVVTLDLDQLECLDQGSILHWDFNHFVVLDRVVRGGVEVVDPKRGRWRVSTAQLRRSFTGVAILLEPDDHFVQGARTERRVLAYLRQVLSERRFVPHILACSLLLQGFGLALPLLNRLLIDRVIPQHDSDLLVVLGAATLFLLVFQASTSIVRSYLLLYLRTRLDSRMTLGFLDHLLDLPFKFFQERTTGDLLMRMSSNSIVREILTGTVLSTFLDGPLALGYLALLLAVSPPMAALAVGLCALQVALLLFTRHRQREMLAEGLQAQARSQSYQVEILTAVETLKALGAERRAVEWWSGLFAAELNVSLKRGRLDAMIEASTNVVRTGSTMILLGVGALQVLGDRMTLGDMMAVNAVAAGFLGPVLSLVSAAPRLQQLGVYMERLLDVLETPAEHEGAAAGVACKLLGGVSVEDVSFRYSPVSQLVLDHVTIDIQPGEFVAIVGPTGSGKSTLARLLVSLYAPSEGRVCFDGVDVRLLDVTDLRRQLGLVTQQPQLFAGSIRSNIALTSPTLPVEGVVQAARLACVHDEIAAMPMGYDTLLIDRGASLSGGQQQRIALARALLTQPKLLVLDEATSQLDAVTERKVQEALGSLGCTLIVIAHSLSTVIGADRILVLDKGRLVEEGTHEILLRHSGIYATLVKTQLSPAAHVPAQ